MSSACLVLTVLEVFKSNHGKGTKPNQTETHDTGGKWMQSKFFLESISGSFLFIFIMIMQWATFFREIPCQICFCLWAPNFDFGRHTSFFVVCDNEICESREAQICFIAPKDWRTVLEVLFSEISNLQLSLLSACMPGWQQGTIWLTSPLDKTHFREIEILTFPVIGVNFIFFPVFPVSYCLHLTLQVPFSGGACHFIQHR